MQPADRSFDDPATSIATELSPVLRSRSDTAFAVWADQVDVAFGESVAERIAVGGTVVDQLVRNVGSDRRVEQRLEEIHLGVVGCIDCDGQWQPSGVAENHDFGSLATSGLADAIAPFFAEANVPSAKPSCQATWPLRSSLRTTRFQAFSSAPLPDHSTKRRQHVTYEGNRGGKSFQRAPLRSTHKMPSKQALGLALGRPPLGLGAEFAKRSEISDQCSSLSSGRKSSISGSVLDPAIQRDRSVIEGLLSTSNTNQRNQRFS